ncbi:MAG: LysM domain-containing protein, partial [Bacillus sp. (in: firmicutes)]
MKVGSEDMAIHVVRSGETLWAISNLYGVSISSIVRDNGLMSIDYIVPGLALYIPENRTSFY